MVGQALMFVLFRQMTFPKKALFPDGVKGLSLTPAFAPTPHDFAGSLQQEYATLPSSTLFSELAPISPP